MFISQKLSIPVYSIGAGLECDGQLIICGDMLGQFEAFSPKFVKKYANLAEIIKTAFREYVSDVKGKKFPEKKHSYPIKDSLDDFKKLFEEFKN